MVQESAGQRIERARLLRNWTQGRLAAELDASRQSVYRWEHDEAVPTLKIREKLIEVLGLPQEIFLPKKERQTHSREENMLQPQFSSPAELAAYVSRHSPVLLFKGWRETKRQKHSLVNLTYVTLNGYPLPAPIHWNVKSSHFDWGYKTENARRLAVSILQAYFAINKDDDLVAINGRGFDDKSYDFTKEVTEELPLDQWELSSEDIREWLRQRRERGKGKNLIT